MRVLIATNSRRRGSTSRVLEGWVHLLPAFGIEPRVSVGGQGPLLDALRSRKTWVSVCPLDVIPERRWPLPFVAAVLRFAFTIRASGAQIVHVNETEAYFVASRAARLAGVPVIAHTHFRPEPDYAQWLFKPGYQPQRLFFPSATSMRDAAPALEAVVSRDRWRIVPNGLDLRSFGLSQAARSRLRAAWGVDESTIALGTACAISPIKRVDQFIRLVARLIKDGLPVRGFVAGRPHFPRYEALVDDLRQLAEKLGIANRLTFLGYVEPSEPLYHAWDICVSTSAYESFGMTLLEAMACRCATVGYDVGAVREVAGNSAHLVSDGDEQALFHVCRQLCLDHTSRRVLGEAGRQRVVSTFDMEAIAAQLADEYRQTVADLNFARVPATST